MMSTLQSTTSREGGSGKLFPVIGSSWGDSAEMQAGGLRGWLRRLLQRLRLDSQHIQILLRYGIRVTVKLISADRTGNLCSLIGLVLPASSFSMTNSMHWLFQGNYLHVYLWHPTLRKLIHQRNTELQVSNGRRDSTFMMPWFSSPKFFATFTTVAKCELPPLCWTSLVLSLSFYLCLIPAP